jgi:hypothetical protein
MRLMLLTLPGLVLCNVAAAQCSPQILSDMRGRGVAIGDIQRLCGDSSPSSAIPNAGNESEQSFTNICSITPTDRCTLNGSGPIGAPCTCFRGAGLANGFVSRIPKDAQGGRSDKLIPR